MKWNVMKRIVGFFKNRRRYLDLKPIQKLNSQGVEIYTPSFFSSKTFLTANQAIMEYNIAKQHINKKELATFKNMFNGNPNLKALFNYNVQGGK